MTSLRSLLVALSFGVLATGCLARGGAAGATAPEPEEDEDGPIPVVASDGTPPGQQEVAWEDNGVPIRQLTGPGRPREMKAGEDDRPKLEDIEKKPAPPKK